MTRYFLTHVDRNGMRRITSPNSNGYKTAFEGVEFLTRFLQDNNPKILAEAYGEKSVKTFAIFPVECFENGFPKGIFIDDPATNNMIEKRVRLVRLSKEEKLRIGDFHSLDNGQTLKPLMHSGSEGLSVSEFAKDRSFWRIISWK